MHLWPHSRRSRKIPGCALFLCLLGSVLLPGVCLRASEADLAGAFLEHLRYLASDRLRGRGNGTPELDEAATYIARRFREYGLEPAGEGGGYFQSFELIMGQALGPENHLTILEDPPLELEAGRDYLPLSLGDERSVEGSLVFVGFGISAPELNYDDYQHQEVAGKVVVAFEHEPQEQREDSPFSGAELSPYASVLHKILNARERGARGLILLSDWFQHPAGRKEKTALESRVEKLGLHVVRLNQEASRRLLEATGRDPLAIADWINGHLTPYTFQIDLRVTLGLDVIPARRTLRNVVGRVPGGSRRTLVIGAHYDHLGMGASGSLAEDGSQIHNGADDNASGTAGLLELARHFGGASPPRSLLFIAFAGEELGLLGSRHYAEHPRVPLADTEAMVNLDMIGRSQGDLIIGGVGSADQFEGLLDRLREGTPLELTYNRGTVGSSDHQSFASRRIPVLFFFTGLHRDYHRPSDDWEKIDVPRTLQVLDLVRATLEGLIQLPGELGYREQRVEAGREGRRRRRVRLGILPDMSWTLGGVRLDQVVEGSPAALAGMKEGDVLLTFGGQPIRNLNSLTSLLRERKAGEEVEVTGLRRGDPVRFRVELLR